MDHLVIHWKQAILGGVFTAFLFSIRKTIIGYILTTVHINSIFGSASVLAILMVWVYYTSQIIFFGAAFIYVVSEKMGYQIRPNKLGVKVDCSGSRVALGELLQKPFFTHPVVIVDFSDIAAS